MAEKTNWAGRGDAYTTVRAHARKKAHKRKERVGGWGMHFGFHNK